MTNFDLNAFLPYNMHVATAILVRSLQAIYKGYGIDIPQWRILVHLGNAEGFMAAYTIRKRTFMSKVTFTRSTAKLEKMGWIYRQINKKDRRHKEIMLTETGREVYINLVQDVNAWNQQLTDKLGKENIDTLIQLSRIIQQKL